MNYELALKLKEAGFPQIYKQTEPWCDWAYHIGDEELHLLHDDNDTGWWLGNDYTRRDMSQEEMECEWVKAPTLEELIEACQSHPMNRKDIGLHGGENKWTAWARKTRLDEGGDGDRDCVAITPTEAVAHLWLALNSK